MYMPYVERQLGVNPFGNARNTRLMSHVKSPANYSKVGKVCGSHYIRIDMSAFPYTTLKFSENSPYFQLYPYTFIDNQQLQCNYSAHLQVLQ